MNEFDCASVSPVDLVTKLFICLSSDQSKDRVSFRLIYACFFDSLTLYELDRISCSPIGLRAGRSFV